jgi:hypothetical protein
MLRPFGFPRSGVASEELPAIPNPAPLGREQATFERSWPIDECP